MKKSTLITLSAVTLITFFAVNVFGQTQNSHAEVHASTIKTTWIPIFNKALTDTGLINKKFNVYEWTLAPGFTDTTSHRHVAEVFIYVVEGSIEHQSGKNEPTILKKGQILHEPPYSLHSFTKNASTTEAAKLLVMFLYTDGPGAPIYLREYPQKK